MNKIRKLESVLTATEQTALKSFVVYYPSAAKTIDQLVRNTTRLTDAGKIVKVAHKESAKAKKLVSINDDKKRLAIFNKCIDDHLK